MFDNLLHHLNQSIVNKGGTSIPLDKELAECISTKNNGRIISYLWKVNGFRRWRVTRFKAGESIQVLNSVAYPEYTNEQPIMGIDLLLFPKKNKLVAVLDFQPLIQEELYLERYLLALKNLRLKYPAFNNQVNMRSFDPKKYFSPWLLFFQGEVDEVNDYFQEAFKSFLRSYWELETFSRSNKPILSRSQIKQLQIQYDEYGFERDPAHGLFSSYFGKYWAERFLNEFLYPERLNKDFSNKEESF